jgi:predicted RNase H-like nuclease (RuvC/YqgF family)
MASSETVIPPDNKQSNRDKSPNHEDTDEHDDELTQNKNVDLDSSQPRPRGRPPGKLAKIQQNLDDANAKLQEQTEEINKLKLDLDLTTAHLEDIQQDQNQTDNNVLQQLTIQQTAQIDSKDSEIKTLMETTNNQELKITQLTKQNVKLKTANMNLLERLATHELNSAVSLSTPKTTPPQH